MRCVLLLVAGLAACDTTSSTVEPEVQSSDTQASEVDTTAPSDTTVPSDTAIAQDTAVAQDTEPAPDTGSSDTAVPQDVEEEVQAPVCEGDCGLVERTATEHFIETLESCHFILDPPTPPANALIDALTAQAGGALTVSDIFGALNRSGEAGVTAQTADRLVNHAWQGFRWNSGDMDTADWYPQGITGSNDAVDSGRVDGRRALLVSWYHKTDLRPTRGARISLADISDLNQVRYRHMLLVEPMEASDGSATFGPAQYDYGSNNALHAGGIVWYGDKLYVADTSRGLRVFDLSRIFRISHVDDKTRIGVSAGRIDAHGYRYAVPQVARYVLSSDSCSVRFSFAGLDRSTAPHHIITGEYQSDNPNGRLVAWPLDPATELLAPGSDGRIHAVEAWVGAQTRMQGALTLDGNVYISSSSQTPSRFGRLYRTRPGQESSISAWPYGCEDLTYEPDTQLIWTAAEHPGTRDVVGIPLRLP